MFTFVYIYLYMYNICKHIYICTYVYVLYRGGCDVSLCLYIMYVYIYLSSFFFQGSFADVQCSFACVEICLDMYLCAAGGVGAAQVGEQIASC